MPHQSTPTITVVNIARLNVGHQLGRSLAIPVGAAVLTGQLDSVTAQFTLNSFVLGPSDPSDALLAWLDQRLIDERATIAGYQLAEATELLETLPSACWSPALRSLAGAGLQPLIDLSARELHGHVLPLHEACAHSRICFARVDDTQRFTTWCRSDVALIDRETQVDVIVTWRLFMKRLAVLNDHSGRVVSELSEHFTAWLRAQPGGAARLHAADMAQIDS